VTHPDIQPEALTARQSAAYLGVGLTHFHQYVRQDLPVHDLRRPGSGRPMWRWLRNDLMAYLTARRREVA